MTYDLTGASSYTWTGLGDGIIQQIADYISAGQLSTSGELIVPNSASSEDFSSITGLGWTVTFI